MMAARPSGQGNSACAPIRACQVRGCGLVSPAVWVYDVSGIAHSDRLALCPPCAAIRRADALTIVERVEESELAA
jgi:hypothetical protein